MSYTLESFCDDVRGVLAEADNHDGRDRVRQLLERLLAEPAFCAAHVGDDAETGVQQIYEDPDVGFCVLAYNMDAPRTSPPHDHGDSWAVYGQTRGYTDMTIWSAAPIDAGNLKAERTFRLDPGQAGLFDVGEIHSIDYAQGARFVRVTGVDMSTTTRRVYDPEAGSVREIKHVGTGSNRQ